MNLPILFHAPFLFTGPTAELIANGWVLVDKGGRVLETGSGEIPRGHPVRYVEGLLCPGLFNSHCHTELSYLQGAIEKGQGLQGFLQGVEQHRSKNRAQAAQAAADAIADMYSRGVVFTADICNSLDTLQVKKESPMFFHHFVELFAFMPERAEEVFARGREKWEAWGADASITFHATYSVSDVLLEMINRHATEHKGWLSLHNQESEDENELYQSGTGATASRLLQWGMNLHHWKTGASGALQGILSKMTSHRPLMLVHNTVTTPAEMQWAMQMHPQLAWCLCPAANLYIENKLPAADFLFNERYPVVIGTDSLASNESLDLVREMRILQEAYGIRTAALLQAITYTPAQFFGRPELGTLSPGTRPGLVQITGITPQGLLTPQSESVLLVPAR